MPPGEGPQYQFTPFGRTVAAQYPDDIPPGAVTLPQIAPESLGTPPRCEDLGPGAPFEAELVAPCGQQADDQPQRVGHGDHFVHIREITLVGPGEPRIGKRQVAVGIGDTQSVTFREADGLYDREPFPGAVFEIGGAPLRASYGGTAPTPCRPDRRTACRRHIAGNARRDARRCARGRKTGRQGAQAQERAQKTGTQIISS